MLRGLWLCRVQQRAMGKLQAAKDPDVTEEMSDREWSRSGLPGMSGATSTGSLSSQTPSSSDPKETEDPDLHEDQSFDIGSFIKGAAVRVSSLSSVIFLPGMLPFHDDNNKGTPPDSPNESGNIEENNVVHKEEYFPYVVSYIS